MKKLFLIATIITCSFLFAQNNNFEKNYSTTNLYKIQKTIPQNKKNIFYKQILKAKLFELIKSNFKKNYSDLVLQKFSDTIVTNYDEAESVDEFMNLQTYEEFIKRHKEYISRTPEDVEKENQIGNSLAKDSALVSSVSSYMEKVFGKDYIKNQNLETNKRIAIAAKKTETQLRKEYDSISKAHNEEIENSYHSENNRKRIIAQIDEYFAKNKNLDDIFFDLLVENLAPEFRRTFPYPHKYAEFPISEIISGDILSYAENGGGNVTSPRYYKIINNNIIPISLYADKEKEEMSFKSKLKKYISLDEFYIDNITLEKRDGKGNYLIDAYLTNENMEAKYQIKYSTKDFISFTPFKIKSLEEKAKWIYIHKK